MKVLGAVGAARVLVALVAAALCGHPPRAASATLNSVLNSNAIKNLPPPLGGASGHPGSAVSVAPGVLYDGANKYQTIDHYQVRRASGTRRRRAPGEGPSGKKGAERAARGGRSARAPRLGAVGGNAFCTGGQKRSARSAGGQGGGPWGPRCVMPSRPFPQPYPCAEDEECGADEYCARPSRAGGAGAQGCLACRKRRKRCMRHAMCCPGNFCKNGEFLRSPDSSAPPLLACRCEKTSPRGRCGAASRGVRCATLP